MNCYVSKVRLFNVSFVYSVPLSLQVVLFGRKEENIVEMYILGNVEKKKKKRCLRLLHPLFTSGK